MLNSSFEGSATFDESKLPLAADQNVWCLFLVYFQFKRLGGPQNFANRNQRFSTNDSRLSAK